MGGGVTRFLDDFRLHRPTILALRAGHGAAAVRRGNGAGRGEGVSAKLTAAEEASLHHTTATQSNPALASNATRFGPSFFALDKSTLSA